jgi:hypothetical protein
MTTKRTKYSIRDPPFPPDSSGILLVFRGSGVRCGVCWRHFGRLLGRCCRTLLVIIQPFREGVGGAFLERGVDMGVAVERHGDLAVPEPIGDDAWMGAGGELQAGQTVPKIVEADGRDADAGAVPPVEQIWREAGYSEEQIA